MVVVRSFVSAFWSSAVVFPDVWEKKSNRAASDEKDERMNKRSDNWHFFSPGRWPVLYMV
jgi:hypothetical protein